MGIWLSGSSIRSEGNLRQLGKSAAILSLAFMAIALGGCEQNDAANSNDDLETSIEGPALEIEPLNVVENLPHIYPSNWFFAHDVNFFNMLDGKIVILDAEAGTKEYKGQLPAGQAASFAFSKTNNEIYVAETLLENRVSGERRDILSIYDTASLGVKDRISLPAKRYQGMPFESSFALVDSDKMGLIFNFTPAASVTVVDIPNRRVLSEVPLPGCAMIFPAGIRAFSSVCGDGAIVTISLDAAGAVIDEKRTKPFIDIDNNAMFLKNANIGSVRYFPTYLGDIQPVDFSGGSPKLLEKWPLTDDQERKAGWRPGGWNLISENAAGEIFILMHQQGKEGSHKDPGSELWVFDSKSKKRVRKIELRNPAISIHVTKGKSPRLIAFNVELELDIYDANSGKWSHKIGGLATETSFGLYGVE